MTLMSIEKDLDTLSMTVTARFAAPVDRVWQLWADPRKLERWWGPPTYPATVVEHDLTPGGRVTYFMTGPEGDRHGGYWNVIDVDAPHRLEVSDGFLGDDGQANDDLPTTEMLVQLQSDGVETVVITTSTFASREGMEQLLAMGMEEGLTEAMTQMDALIA
jgi:uncharacterized protein YndB with AHSA1/START domain